MKAGDVEPNGLEKPVRGSGLARVSERIGKFDGSPLSATGEGAVAPRRHEFAPDDAFDFPAASPAIMGN